MKNINFSALSGLLILFSLLNPCSLQAQDLTPGPPVLHSAGLVAGTDSIQLNWKLSDSANVAYYCAYTNFGIGWVRIDSTHNSTDTTLVFHFPEALLAPQRFCLAAVPLTGNFNSPLSNEHRSFLHTLMFDSCNMKFRLQWTNYEGWGSEIKEYRIFSNVDGEGELLQMILPADTTGFEFVPEENRNYCLRMEAVSSVGYRAGSNQSCLSSRVSRPPDWIAIGRLEVVNEQLVLLEVHTDPKADPMDYTLMRATSPLGSFASIGQYHTDEPLFNMQDAVGQLFPAFYRVWAVNSCGDSLISSPLATAMDVQIQTGADELKVQWTSCLGWAAGVDRYELYRSLGAGGAEKIAELTGNETSYSESSAELAAKGLAGTVCYFVDASEAMPSYQGIGAVSRSRIACTGLETRFLMPDGFTPNKDGANDEFAPVFNFLPSKYLLLISNLSGKLLFRSTNPGEAWDGTDRSGALMPPGAYTWTLQFTDYSGKTVTRKGLLTLFQP